MKIRRLKTKCSPQGDIYSSKKEIGFRTCVWVLWGEVEYLLFAISKIIADCNIENGVMMMMRMMMMIMVIITLSIIMLIIFFWWYLILWPGSIQGAPVSAEYQRPPHAPDYYLWATVVMIMMISDNADGITLSCQPQNWLLVANSEVGNSEYIHYSELPTPLIIVYLV